MKRFWWLLMALLMIAVAAFISGRRAEAPSDGRTWLVYEDEAAGFSFKYPAEFVSGVGRLNLPGPASETIKTVTLTRWLDRPHPLLSGEVEPRTMNPRISLAVLQGPMTQIAEDFTEAYGPAEIFALTGRQITRIRAGVEGEGEFYYLAPISSTRALVFAVTYIDENIVSGYQNQPNFLTQLAQEELTQQILATLEFKS